MAALQGTAGNAAVQRLVEGDGRGLTVDQLRAQLLSRFPGSNPTYRDVQAEHRSATVHPSIDALGEHLGLGATRQPGTTPAAPAAATPAARPPVPPKPRPAPPGPRQTGERSAASAAPAAATTPATRPPVPPKR
ncbi:hypothetical protein NGM37_53040, partial [Streptomyces sp. TRM76130]|nr:hypothetical protein [Streptomyces sp. TRM76130]